MKFRAATVPLCDEMRERVREKSRFYSVAGGGTVGSIEWMLSQPMSSKHTCTAHRRSRIDQVKRKRSKPVGTFSIEWPV